MPLSLRLSDGLVIVTVNAIAFRNLPDCISILPIAEGVLCTWCVDAARRGREQMPLLQWPA